MDDNKNSKNNAIYTEWIVLRSRAARFVQKNGTPAVISTPAFSCLNLVASSIEKFT